MGNLQNIFNALTNLLTKPQLDLQINSGAMADNVHTFYLLKGSSFIGAIHSLPLHFNLNKGE